MAQSRGWTQTSTESWQRGQYQEWGEKRHKTSYWEATDYSPSWRERQGDWDKYGNNHPDSWDNDNKKEWSYSCWKEGNWKTGGQQGWTYSKKWNKDEDEDTQWEQEAQPTTALSLPQTIEYSPDEEDQPEPEKDEAPKTHPTSGDKELWCPNKGWCVLSVLNLGKRRNEKKPYKNGKKKKGVNEEMRQLIVNFPCHITAIQEYDENYLLEEDKERFHIVAPNEKEFEHGTAILARKYNARKDQVCIDKVVLLEETCIKLKPLSPKKPMSWTPMMVVQIELPHGKTVRILNMHFSYHQAKKEVGYKKAYDTVINKMVEFITNHDVHLLVGDFNGAAKDIGSILKDKGITATMDEELKELERQAEARGDGQPLRIFQIGTFNPCKAIIPRWERPDVSAHPALIRGFGCRGSSEERKMRRHQQKVNRNQAIVVNMQSQRTYRKRRLSEKPLI